MKVTLIVLGTIAFLMGLMDSLAGALVPHGRGLIIWGVIGLAIAGVLHLRKKWQQRHTFPLLSLAVVIFGIADTCAAGPYDQVLTPPDTTPMIQRSLVTGSEVWFWILAIVLVSALTCIFVQKFLRYCFRQPQNKK